MWSRNQRQGAARLFLRRLMLLALLALLAAAVSGVWGISRKERESAARRAEAESERADLLMRRAQLESDIAKLRTDRGVEETLREQFALAERGEKLIVIVEPPAPASLKATSTIVDWLKKSLRWW